MKQHASHKIAKRAKRDLLIWYIHIIHYCVLNSRLSGIKLASLRVFVPLPVPRTSNVSRRVEFVRSCRVKVKAETGQEKENGREALSDHNIHNVGGAMANAELSNGCILVWTELRVMREVPLVCENRGIQTDTAGRPHKRTIRSGGKGISISMHK